MTTLTVYDHKGTQIQLGGSGKAGGEGTMYPVQGKPDQCAKVYHQHKLDKEGKELHEKVWAMFKNPPHDPTWLTMKHRSISWPDGILYKDVQKTQFLGFTMPFIDTTIFQEAHKYYDESDRLSKIGGGFTWRYLFTAAYNIVSAILALHKNGNCVGDLRETNILVAKNTLITLIDCDSFQIKDKTSGRVYYTRVGTGEYLPPELIGVDFKSEDYDRYHSDLFGLGILIFKFLMLGAHPYQAKGKLVDDASSPEAKIKKGYFAYSGKFKGIEPPDHAYPYSIIPPSIQELFNRCFIEGHKEPTKRPSAEEWFDALKTERGKLKECNANKNHWYSNHLQYCPWCQVDSKTKKDPFPSSVGQQIALADPNQPLDSIDKKISYLRNFIDMALSDGVITLDEKEHVIDIGLNKLFIPKKEIEKVIDAEIKKYGAKISTTSKAGTPVLEIDKSSFDFNNIRAGLSPTNSFTISNIGGGTLSGPIKSNKKWLKISQNNIDTSKHKQDIIFNIDTSGLPFGFSDTGIIEIQSNGGTEKVSVNLSVEMPEADLSRFRLSLTICGLIIGALVGLITNITDITAIAAFVALVSVAIVGGILVYKDAGVVGSVIVWVVGTLIIGAIVFSILESYFPRAFSTIVWALTYSSFGYLLSTPIRKALWQGNTGIPIAAGITVLALTGVILIGGKQITPIKNKKETSTPSAPEVSRNKDSTTKKKVKTKKQDSPAYVPASLNGAWDGYFLAYGKKINFELTLNHNGSSVSGSINEDGSYTADIEGQIKGNSITFVKKYEGRGFEPVEYVGTISNSKIRGKWIIKKTGVSGEWTATKRG